MLGANSRVVRSLHTSFAFVACHEKLQVVCRLHPAPAMRSVDWLQQTSRSLAASFPSLGQRSSLYVSHRLSRLILERLPSDIGCQLLELLPRNDESGDVADREELRDLYAATERAPDLSIGYPAFIEQASRSIHEMPRTRPGESHEDFLE